MCTQSAASPAPLHLSADQLPAPGVVALFGSGETSASGRAVYDMVMKDLSSPIRAAVLETPAGFQPNSASVAEEVAVFLRHHLQNHRPEVTVIPARARGTSLSPDDPAAVAPMLHCNVIFLGPGSPTYAARQLHNSLAWHAITALHRLGASVVLASAATIAAGVHVLPVYEIFKAGEDLHWQAGLDFFGPYGLPLVFVPHWNNTEGGADLDTSRGFMGRPRFEKLLTLLPARLPVVGIDEHTALVMEISVGRCRVMGLGGVTVITDGEERRFTAADVLPISVLGVFHLPQPEEGVPHDVWVDARTAWRERAGAVPLPPPEVLALWQERKDARGRGDWSRADVLRKRMATLGWQVLDTPEGPRLEIRPQGLGTQDAAPAGRPDVG
jgi:hypothetical protein